MGNLKTERDGFGRRLAATFQRRLTDGARDERGAVAIIFALAIVVLVPLLLGLFDLYTATEQRSRLQDAIDAAALYAARSDLNTDSEINALANKALNANLRLIRGATLVSSEFHLTSDKTTVVGSATIQPLAVAPAFGSHPAFTVGTQVVRNSKNLEVSLMLDITGSMAGTKISDLRTAAQQLVDIVVKDQQTPFYSRLAVVPWSMGVNLGTGVNLAHGAVAGTRTITGISSWMSGSQLDVNGATQANPVVITTNNNHNFTDGQVVMLTGVSGMTQINNVPYKIKTTGNQKKFSLQTLAGVNVDGTGFGAYSTSSSDKVTKCAATDCTMTVTTSSAHGYVNGDYVFIDDVTPSALDTTLDDNMYQISGVTPTTFNIFVSSAPTTAYTSGGTSYCTKYGCEFYRFANANSGAIKLFKTTTCVSERTGAEKYTDLAPSSAPVGFNYAATNTTGTALENTAVSDASTPNPCLGDEVIPLSTDKTTIKAKIGALQAAGSTAGQVGTAWGWYMISPNFSSVFPSAPFQPAAYGTPNTLKVVVLMTDGALNSPYCNGVIANDALSGSGSSVDHESCNATNGTTLAQSLALCNAMKAPGKDIIIYTVGFQITGDTNAQTLINTCATDAKHVYLPTSGTQLKDAFKAIGVELNNLRISH